MKETTKINAGMIMPRLEWPIGAAADKISKLSIIISMPHFFMAFSVRYPGQNQSDERR